MAEWHPILNALQEPRPGLWLMIERPFEGMPDTRVYGLIELIRYKGEPAFRAELVQKSERQLVGRYATLRGAVESVHGAYVAGHGPGGHPGGVNG